jgi:hypothetical protein
MVQVAAQTHAVIAVTKPQGNLVPMNATEINKCSLPKTGQDHRECTTTNVHYNFNGKRSEFSNKTSSAGISPHSYTS